MKIKSTIKVVMVLMLTLLAMLVWWGWVCCWGCCYSLYTEGASRGRAQANCTYITRAVSSERADLSLATVMPPVSTSSRRYRIHWTILSGMTPSVQCQTPDGTTVSSYILCIRRSPKQKSPNKICLKPVETILWVKLRNNPFINKN